MELNDAEKRAIRALKRLEKIWPDSLWLLCHGTSNGLRVMLKRDGEKALDHLSEFDQDYEVAHTQIESDACA